MKKLSWKKRAMKLKKKLVEYCIINFINGWGLEARDTIIPLSSTFDPKEGSFKFAYEISYRKWGPI